MKDFELKLKGIRLVLNAIIGWPYLGLFLDFSALVVRFITKRFIGEYDPTLEKTYMFHTVMENEMIYFEILDTAGQPYVRVDNSASYKATIR